jgi:hypothetical protein
MAKRSVVDKWRGGRLTAYTRTGPTFVRINRSTAEFEPLGHGWAIQTGVLGEWWELLEAEVLLEAHDGRITCVAVRSTKSEPDLARLLRGLAPAIRKLTRTVFEDHARHLVELDDGTVGYELDFEKGLLGEPDASGANVEYDRRHRGRGRKPLSEDHLKRVAALYREAAVHPESRIEYLQQHFPHNSPATIRNWIRKARARGFLRPAPRPGVAGETK